VPSGFPPGFRHPGLLRLRQERRTRSKLPLRPARRWWGVNPIHDVVVHFFTPCLIPFPFCFFTFWWIPSMPVDSIFGRAPLHPFPLQPCLRLLLVLWYLYLFYPHEPIPSYIASWIPATDSETTSMYLINGQNGTLFADAVVFVVICVLVHCIIVFQEWISVAVIWVICV